MPVAPMMLQTGADVAQVAPRVMTLLHGMAAPVVQATHAVTGVLNLPMMDLAHAVAAMMTAIIALEMTKPPIEAVMAIVPAPIRPDREGHDGHACIAPVLD
jgi:hypothetical protein